MSLPIFTGGRKKRRAFSKIRRLCLWIKKKPVAKDEAPKYSMIEDTDVSNFDKLVPKDKYPISFPFELDDFQKRSIYRITQKDNVFVVAHTSAGKTVMAEWAIATCIKKNSRAIYTSPIKALSNQKYRDFKKDFQQMNLNQIWERTVHGEQKLIG